MHAPAPASFRFKVEPRDVPPRHAARRLGLTTSDFQRALPELLERGFPKPDSTTGNFDLAAIERWMEGRHAEEHKSQDVMLERIARL
jgi:DNA-binding IclR family transcriptional regulator